MEHYQPPRSPSCAPKSLFALPSQRQPTSLLTSNNMDLVLTLFELYANKITQYGSSCVWFLLFNIMLVRFIHIVACDRNLFIFSAAQYFIVSLYHILVIQSSIDGHLSCFWFGATTNIAVMNRSIYVGIYLGVELLEHMAYKHSASQTTA